MSCRFRHFQGGRDNTTNGVVNQEISKENSTNYDTSRDCRLENRLINSNIY